MVTTRAEPRSRLRSDVLWAAGAVVVTCLIAALVLKLWNADMHVPFSYEGDALHNQMVVKGVLEHGWYEHNPSLGAPFGQTLYDFPVVSGDNLQILLMKVIGLFTSDSALVVNLFFLLTFPLAAVSAFACLRLLGIARAPAAVAASLFALLPYHFIHGETHLFISAYYGVPIGAYLALRALNGPPLRLRRRRELVLVVLACLVVGSTHVYYAAFAIALLCIAALIRVVVGPWRSAATAAVFVALIGGTVLGNHLPNLVYLAQHGKNPATQREPSDTEAYGLKIAQMVLPVADHRLQPLAHLRARYDASGTQRQEGDPQALGTIATLGFVGLIVLALAVVADPRRRPDASEVMFGLAVFTIAAVLLGTTGGLSTVFAYVVWAQLRAWGRIAIYVGFFSLAALALAGNSFVARQGRRVAIGALAAVLLVGVLDQTNAGSAPDYRTTQASYRSDAALVATMEQQLPAGASVFELPYEPFPEPQPQFFPGLGPYDLARGYLHSHDLRWSYGLMKGRAGDWDAAVVQLPPALLARAVVSAGFSGIFLDRSGYLDRGAHALAGLVRETGAKVVASPDGGLAFLDLQAYARRLRAQPGPHALAALRHATLEPLGATYARGFSALQQDLQGRSYQVGADARIVLRNPDPAPRHVRLIVDAEPAYPAAAVLTASFPDGSELHARLPAGARTLTHAFAVPPGASAIVLHVTGHVQIGLPDPGQAYYLRVLDPLLVDRSFAPLGPPPADRRAAAWLAPFGRL